MTKRNYELLLARRESAGLSEQMNQNTDTVKFRVVDPPFVPATPSGPDRPLLSSSALGGGLAAGLIFAIFLAQLNPTFESRRALMEATKLPVLGGVSMIWTEVQLRRRRIDAWSFSLVVVMLLGFYSAVIAIQIQGINPVTHLKGLL